MWAQHCLCSDQLSSACGLPQHKLTSHSFSLLMSEEWSLDAIVSDAEDIDDASVTSQEHRLLNQAARPALVQRLPWAQGRTSERRLRDRILQDHDALPTLPAEDVVKRVDKLQHSSSRHQHCSLAEVMRAASIPTPIYSFVWQLLSSSQSRDPEPQPEIVKHFLNPLVPWSAATKKVPNPGQLCLAFQKHSLTSTSQVTSADMLEGVL